jgi:hypothetical protein
MRFPLHSGPAYRFRQATTSFVAMYVLCQCHARNANLILCLNASGAKKSPKRAGPKAFSHPNHWRGGGPRNNVSQPTFPL